MALFMRGGWKIGTHHLGEKTEHGFDFYMKRWIFQTPWGGARIHCIKRSDLERHLHDHPFDFWSLLLRGAYVEVTSAGRRLYRAGQLNRKRAESTHRLEASAPVWTLVVHGPRRREWGFATETGWVHWRAYEKQYGRGV